MALLTLGFAVMSACGSRPEVQPEPETARHRLENQINGLPTFYKGRSEDIEAALEKAMAVSGVPNTEEGVDRIRISIVGFQDTYRTRGYPLLQCVGETPAEEVNGRSFEDLAEACSLTMEPRVHLTPAPK